MDIYNATSTIIPYLSLIAAFGALWITIIESKRNNSVIVDLVKFNSSLVQDANGFHYKLAVSIKNKGITLRNISVRLNFKSSDHPHGYAIDLPAMTYTNNRDNEFIRGMVSEYELISTETHILEHMRPIRDKERIDACLYVYSHSYIATTLPLTGTLDSLKFYWNQLIWRTTYRLSNILPYKRAKWINFLYFQSQGNKVRSFINESLELNNPSVKTQELLKKLTS